MHPGELLFSIELLFWCGLVLAAPLLTLLALFRLWNRRAIAVTALCLWCVLAGAALMGAMWSWMATENQNLQHRKIARMPITAKAGDVNLEPMKAIVFFVQLDGLGKRLGYATVLLPLIAAVLILKKSLGDSSAEKPKKIDPDNELFTPYGP